VQDRRLDDFQRVVTDDPSLNESVTDKLGRGSRIVRISLPVANLPGELNPDNSLELVFFVASPSNLLRPEAFLFPTCIAIVLGKADSAVKCGRKWKVEGLNHGSSPEAVNLLLKLGKGGGGRGKELVKPFALFPFPFPPSLSKARSERELVTNPSSWSRTEGEILTRRAASSKDIPPLTKARSVSTRSKTSSFF
jgi:hypothetical protein